jgi:hypothetical protein
MTAIEDKPSIGERYTSATESSNLRVGIHENGADIIIAAGWSGDGIGASLLRLRAEFDAVRAEHEQAARALKEAEAATTALEARQAAEEERKRFGPTFAELLRQRAEQSRGCATRSATTARALILIKLKSLPATRDALGRLAVIQATKERYMKPDAEVLKLVGRCLDVWLDPTCPACTGRGFTGGYDGPQVFCRPCSGNGRRRGALGMDEVEQRFSKHILGMMDRSVSAAETTMRRRLNWAPTRA